MDSNAIGKKLRDLRGNKTQTEVAFEIGLKPSTYAMYEVGQRIPRDENKKRIASYYQKTVEEIFYS